MGGGPTWRERRSGWASTGRLPCAGIDAWNDIDPDKDRHPNSDDYDDYDPGTY